MEYKKMNEQKQKKTSLHIPYSPVSAQQVVGAFPKRTMHISHEGKAYRLSRSAHTTDPYDLRSALLEKEVFESTPNLFLKKTLPQTEKKRIGNFAKLVQQSSIPPRENRKKILSISSLPVSRIPHKKRQTVVQQHLLIPQNISKPAQKTFVAKKFPLPVLSKKQKLMVEVPPVSIPVALVAPSLSQSLPVTPLKKKTRAEISSPKKEISKTSRFFARHRKRRPKKAKKDVQKTTFLGEMLRFGMTTAIIFLVSFTAMNASALGQLLSARLNPVAVVEKEIALKKVIANKHAPILPTAGMKFENRKTYPSLNLAIAPLENRIVIPKIGKNIPIVEISDKSLVNEQWKQLENDIQDALHDGVVHYPGTAQPGQIGNVFITGHSSYYFWDNGKYKDVFALLHDLYEGDEFTIFWNQNVYHYRITERKVVSPDDTSVLNQPRDRRIATLMTCTPVGTAKDRLILVAEQINKENT